MVRRQYQLAENFDPKVFVNSICEFIDSKYNAEVQVFGTSDDSAVQIRERNNLKKLTGMSSAITIRVKIENNFLYVEQGRGKWIDKIAVAGLGALIFWPLIALPGIGVFLQDKMHKDISRHIEDYLESNNCKLILGYVINTDKNNHVDNNENSMKCPKCGISLNTDSKFCNECGISVGIKCSECNENNPIDFNFCRVCGIKLKD